MDFTNISFHGTFRDYQKHVLDNINKHLSNNKIHIVAAPGSGKTILGLEIIRLLNTPAIILSPAITIRQQWGERFVDHFMTPSMDEKGYISYSLLTLKLITSVTYQSLHSAMNRLIEQNDEDEDYEKENETDYTNYDLVKECQLAGIKTICLDEAHHLRSEWQSSLEDFIKKLGKDIKVIALTATPPYDSTPSEWNKYISICGEIDEEIYVPQLVRQNTLCPHQDYIYFNYPSNEEMAIINIYKNKVVGTINTILNAPTFQQIINNIIISFKQNENYILEHVKEYIAIFTLASLNENPLPPKLIKVLTVTGKLPSFKLHYAEEALQFIIDNEDKFTGTKELKKILLEESLIERKKVCFVTNDRIKKSLVSSIGKLISIQKVAMAEYATLKDNLRMLVLTDYIKKEIIKIIGSDIPLNVIGTVSVFETIRRTIDPNARLAVLSGSLTILPQTALKALKELSQKDEVSFNSREINNTGYYEIDFTSNNKNKVKMVTQLFNWGHINILVGTKSLLGEGWDSPCINSLILASFVGSFMLSNQMRGRAIRIDQENPNKVANIWHLVTIEPTISLEKNILFKSLKYIFEDKNEIISSDYDTLKRRFTCFMGPSYSRDVIESGIDRIDILKPPFTEESFNDINIQMLSMAKHRELVKDKWNRCISNAYDLSIEEQTDIPDVPLLKSATFFNAFYNMLYTIIISIMIRGFIGVSFTSLWMLMAYIVIMGVIVYLLIVGLTQFFRLISPRKTIESLSQCVLKTLKEMDVISYKAKVRVKSNDLTNISFYVSLENATTYEQNTFAIAIKELMSEIDNPKYVLIKQSFIKYVYHSSFACPTIIGKNKENVEKFQNHLTNMIGKFVLFFTRTEEGRKKLLKCRKYSLVNINGRILNSKKKVKSNYR